MSAAQQHSFLDAFGGVIAGGQSRTRGLEALCALGREGYGPATLALAVELVRMPDARLVETVEDWALAAHQLGHPGPIGRLIARADIGGDTKRSASLRALRLGVPGSRDARLKTAAIADLEQEIGLIEAGAPHRDFGLERLRDLATSGTVGAGLLYADELVETAPPGQEPFRAGWAEAAAALGHHAPMLRLISLMEEERLNEMAVDLRARHGKILSKEIAAEDADPSEAGALDSGVKVEVDTGTFDAVPAEGAVSDGKRAPAGPRGKRVGWVVEACLVAGAVAGLMMFNPQVRVSLSRLASAPLSGARSTADYWSTPVSVSEDARTYLDRRADEAEARIGQLLAQGREKDADDSAVRAIELAMVSGDVDRLERLLDRQAETTKAIEKAKEDDAETLSVLRKVIRIMSKGFDVSVPPREGYWSRRYIHYYSVDAEADRLHISCKTTMGVRDKEGHPEAIFKGVDLAGAFIDVDLVDLYNSAGHNISGLAFINDFIARCPDRVIYYKKMLFGFCKKPDEEHFRALLGTYLRRAGCIPEDAK